MPRSASPTGADIGVDGFLNFQNLLAGTGNDSITANDADNYIFGDAGNDTVIAGGAGVNGSGTGNDYFDGGTGNNTLDYHEATNDLTIDLRLADRSSGAHIVDAAVLAVAGLAANAPVGLGYGADIGNDGLFNFQNVTGGSGNDTITGDGNANHLIGNAGNDTLTGGPGIDIIEGINGNDTLVVVGSDAVAGETYDGGIGQDTLNVSGGVDFTGSLITSIEGLQLSGTVTFTASQLGAGKLSNSLSVSGSSGGDVIVINMTSGSNLNLSNWSFSNWTPGTSADRIIIDASSLSSHLNITGTSQHDEITGGSNNDTINDGPGDDYVSGGGGNDTFIGSLGNDTYDGGAGNNTMDYSSTSTGVSVDLSVHGATGSQIGTDALYNIEIVTGGSGNDSILGDSAVNTLSGGGGADSIYGRGGDDTIYGGAGDDTLVGGFGSNAPGSGNDTIYGDAGNDDLYGEDGNDILWGGAGADQYAGGAGHDELHFEGDNANDIAWGGDGSDTFYFEKNYGNDTIMDFIPTGGSSDKIDVSAITHDPTDVHISQSGSDAVVTIDGSSGTITVAGVNAAALADDFLF